MFRRFTARAAAPAARRFAPVAAAAPLRGVATRTPMLRCMPCDYEALQVAAVQKPAPMWKAKAVENGAIKEVSLSQYAGKYVVMLFYPLDFTFVCPTEIIAFSDRAAEFEKLNCQLLAVSVDSVFSHLAWNKTDRKKGGLGEMKIPLVADITKEISRDYGVLIESEGIALRGLFVIDDKGIVRSITVNDLPVGRSVDETLRVVEAFQYVDKNGEVVPCNWTPGKPTINVSKAADFFEKNN